MGVVTVGVVTVGVVTVGVLTVGVVTVGVVTVVGGVTGVLGTVTVVLGTVVVGTVVVTVGAGRPTSAGTFTTPATMTEVVANDVSAAIRFRRPLPIGASDTSPHPRINVQFPDVRVAARKAGGNRCGSVTRRGRARASGRGASVTGRP